jgi:hypothetical protein
MQTETIKKIPKTILILTMMCFGWHTTSQRGLSSECYSPDTHFNADLLPKNTRLLITTPEADGYILVDPHDETSFIVPGTEKGGVAYLFRNGQRMLFISTANPERTMWQTMNIDGASPIIVLDEDGIRAVRRLDDNYVFIDNPFWYVVGSEKEPIPYRVMNLDNGLISPVQFLMLNNYVSTVYLDQTPNNPVRLFLSASASRFAYEAYQVNADAQELASKPHVIRIQEVSGNTSIDIGSDWGERYWWFNWGKTDDRLTVAIEANDDLGSDFIEIYDAVDGRLLSRVVEPGMPFALDADNLTWSPDRKHFAVQWDIDNDSLEPNTQGAYTSLLTIYNFAPEPQLMTCFYLPSRAEDENFDGFSTHHWTPDGRFIWWRACPTAISHCREYDLMIADWETGVYGPIMKGVGYHSSIGFLPARRAS